MRIASELVAKAEIKGYVALKSLILQRFVGGIGGAWAMRVVYVIYRSPRPHTRFSRRVVVENSTVVRDRLHCAVVRINQTLSMETVLKRTKITS